MLSSTSHYLRRNAVAFLALFVALGGTATATHLAVNGSDVTDETLTGADIKGKAASRDTPAVDGSLKGEDIRDGTLKSVDLAPSTISTGRVLDDSLNSVDIKDEALTG